MTSLRERELLQIIKERDERIAALEKEVASLNHKVDLLVRRLFGSSSEKLDPAQLELLLGGGGEAGKGDASSEKEEAGVTPFPAAKANTKSGLRRDRAERVPENPPPFEEVIVPEEVKACPQEWRFIG